MIRLAEPRRLSIGESNSQGEVVVTIIIDMEANSMASSWTPMTCLTFSFSELRLREEDKPPVNNKDNNSIGNSVDRTTRVKRLTGRKLCDKWPLF